MVDCAININCRHLWDVFLLIRVTFVTFYTKLQVMSLEVAYKNESCSPTPGRKAWLLFSVRDMSWSLRNPFFLSFLWSVVCKRPVINDALITLKLLTKKTRLVGYFRIVLMKLFELYTFQLDILINCKHLWYVILLSRVTYVTFFYENADYNLKDCISELTMFHNHKCVIKISILMMYFHFTHLKQFINCNWQ